VWAFLRTVVRWAGAHPIRPILVGLVVWFLTSVYLSGECPIWWDRNFHTHQLEQPAAAFYQFLSRHAQRRAASILTPTARAEKQDAVEGYKRDQDPVVCHRLEPRYDHSEGSSAIITAAGKTPIVRRARSGCVILTGQMKLKHLGSRWWPGGQWAIEQWFDEKVRCSGAALSDSWDSARADDEGVKEQFPRLSGRVSQRPSRTQAIPPNRAVGS
jgi:hypothetical protein